jgi:hypothetical protein
MGVTADRAVEAAVLGADSEDAGATLLAPTGW